MGDNLVGIDIEGLEVVQRALKSLPPEIINAASDDLSKYLLNVLRMYPPKNYITRKAAYGQTFQSEKQRRWFFRALNSGEINVPYHRTQKLAGSWKIIGKGMNTIVVSEAEAARWTMGDERSKHERMVGWKQIPEILSAHAAKIESTLAGAAKKAIRKLGL